MSHTDLSAHFAKHGIVLTITKKAIKHINFRLKFHEGVTHFYISTPHHVSDDSLNRLIMSKSAWVMKHHHTHLLHQQTNAPTHTLWGQPLDMNAYLGCTPIANLSSHNHQTNHHACRLAIYEHELKKRLPTLAATWQSKVGQVANEIRTKKMRTRWGSCNTRQRRIWLSIYLAAYPYECTEYVFVHELCHLIHPNHSSQFWATVKKAMPDYRTWHDLLKGKV